VPVTDEGGGVIIAPAPAQPTAVQRCNFCGRHSLWMGPAPELSPVKLRFMLQFVQSGRKLARFGTLDLIKAGEMDASAKSTKGKPAIVNASSVHRRLTAPKNAIPLLLAALRRAVL
jgi:hypothetical protein